MCSYVNDMTSWNNHDINEFQPKCNNDMMQCCICNRFSLFATRLKALKKQKKKKVFLWSKIFFEILLKQETLIHLCMKLRREQHCNATWIEINSNSTKFNPNWNQLSSNSIEEKWNVNWWIRYWNLADEFGVGKRNF
jgi:hypothetical protein